MANQYIDNNAKWRFREAITFLIKSDWNAAFDGFNSALSDGFTEAMCGLMLLKVFTAQNDQYDEIIRDLDCAMPRISGTSSKLEMSAYGYYAIGRCYSFLGIKKERFLSNLFRMAIKKSFCNELMEKAVHFYKQSAERNHSFVDSYFELAFVYDIGLNLREEAIETYRTVIRLNPKHAFARLQLANLYNETKQVAKAQEEAEEVVQMWPTFITYSLLSGIYTRQRKISQALEASKKAKSLLKDQLGMRGAFESRTYLLSPTTLAYVPVF
jgi:tetratricopeptide (TPR) repeat protein